MAPPERTNSLSPSWEELGPKSGGKKSKKFKLLRGTMDLIPKPALEPGPELELEPGPEPEGGGGGGRGRGERGSSDSKEKKEFVEVDGTKLEIDVDVLVGVAEEGVEEG